MRILRNVGNVVLWFVAALGVLSVLIWGATALGWIKPLVVISGSMEPEIMTGDLIFDRALPSADARVGDVASIPSAVTGKIVTHRIIGIEQAADGAWQVTLKGDANKVQDPEPYIVGDTILRPVLQIPGGGYAIVTLTKPSVAVPLLITLLALLGLTMYDPGPRKPADDPAEPDISTPETEVAPAS